MQPAAFLIESPYPARMLLFPDYCADARLFAIIDAEGMSF